ncbi:MAG: hypothetical protein JSW67_03475 [Candidatus Latescibacterota bacterium]|nr:MAG: hypothetical protein JSW67_03475 [Candidatus Latescibacterota bacterium]
MQPGFDAKQAAAYRLASPGATGRRSAVAPDACVVRVLGRRYAESPQGRRLVTRKREWLQLCDAALARLLEFASLERLIQVYRAPLRVERQVVAATYELQTAACLADVVRRLEFDVVSHGTRRCDLRARFLSRTFHVEVKTHESRRAPRRRGGLRIARALERSARGQASRRTPNLLVFGCVSAAAVRRVAAEMEPSSWFGALAWLDLQPRRRQRRATLFPVRVARSPFPEALLTVLSHAFEQL